ncbi:hypothetical protein AAG906_016218 [Vitis piasezkii]
MPKTRGGSTTAPQSSQRAAPVRAPLDAPSHLPDSAPQSRYHTRRASATSVAPPQIPPRSPPTKKAKTSEPGDSSRRPRPTCPLRATPIADRETFMLRHISVTLLCDNLIVDAFHIPFAPADPATFRRWAPFSEWDMHKVQRRGAIMEALFRISEGYYFGPHHLIMAALLHFEEKVHTRHLARADSIPLLFPRLLCHVLAHMGFPTDPRSEPRRHCRESFSLDQWTQIWLHRQSQNFPNPPQPVPEAASSDAPPVVPPTSEPPITIPGPEYRALLASFQTLTTTQTAIMERMDHFQLQQDQQTLILPPPVAVPSIVAAEDPSYPPEEPTT